MEENEFQRRAALADATRRLIRAVRLTQVDPDALEATTELVTQAAQGLEADLFAGPHSQLAFEPVLGINPSVPVEQFFPFSSVVGPLNPISAPLRMEVVDLAELDIEGPAVSATGTAIRARVTLPEQYVGPPFDQAHGGIIAHLFDELLGVATIMGAGGGFTGRLTIHYRKPTPALKPLELKAWVESVSGRKLVARGEIRHEGVVTAEADGLFIQPAGREPGQAPNLTEPVG